MSAQDMLTQARQGNPQAIALILNHFTRPKDIITQVIAEEESLRIVFSAHRLPNQEVMTGFVRKSIEQLDIDSVQIIQVVGQRVGNHPDAWITEIVIEEDGADPAAAGIMPEDKDPEVEEPAQKLDLDPLGQPSEQHFHKDGQADLLDPLEDQLEDQLDQTGRTDLERPDQRDQKTGVDSSEGDRPPFPAPDPCLETEPPSDSTAPVESTPISTHGVPQSRNGHESGNGSAPVNGHRVTSRASETARPGPEVETRGVPVPEEDWPDASDESLLDSAVLRRPDVVVLIVFVLVLVLWQTYLAIIEKAAPEGSLNGRDLARRLAVSYTTISRRKHRADFPVWSQTLDPDGITWVYTDGVFVPQL
jgi:hypothetical protein